MVTEKPRHALVITDLGIMRHQLKLMARYAHLTPICVDLSGEVAKVLEQHECEVVVLELALEWHKDTQAKAEIPTILNYLVEFRHTVSSAMTLIVLLNNQDPRLTAI